MLRYLFPAALMMAALLVLFAGALGDLHSWPHLPSALVSVVHPPPAAPAPSAPLALSAKPGNDAASPANTPPATPSPALASADTALHQQHDALQTQVDKLQSDVAQATQQLASLRASGAQERQALDALTKQRQTAEASLSHLKRQQQRDATAAAAAAHSSSASRPTRLAPRAATSTSRDSSPPPPSPLTTLAIARNALMRGQPDEARPQLERAEAQLAFQPVTPGQPLAAGGNPAATDVRGAIRWLDVGNTEQALQQVDLALANARVQSASNGTVDASPAPASPGYDAYPRQTIPYTSWR